MTVGANGTSVTGQITGNGAEDGTAISGKLTASDLDGLDSTTPYSVSGAAQHGTATIDANGNWSYTPKADYNGADSFTVTVKDALGNLTTQVINITVAAEKDAFDDSGSTTSGQTVKIDVLANDAFEGAHKVVTQVNGTAITAGGAAVAVANGQVTLGTDGQLSFKANAGYTGTAEFNYTVKTDDGTPETAQVSVTVTQPPVFAVISVDKSNVTEGGELIYTVKLVDKYGNDVYVPAGKSVNVALMWSGDAANNSDTTGRPPSVTINGGSHQASFTVKTVDDAVAESSEQLVAKIGSVVDTNGSFDSLSKGTQDTATSTIIDNDAVPDTKTTPEDTAVSANVLVNDPGYGTNGSLAVANFSVNGVSYIAGASVVSVTDLAGKVIGSLSISANGNYSFSPSKDWSGTVPTVTYTTNTGLSSTLNINVTPVADTPLVTVNVGAGSTPVTTSITATSVNTSTAGHTVTAYNVNGSKGTVSTVSGTDHDGFGVSGAASGDSTEIGRNSTGSESLAIQFNIPVTAITVQFAWLASGEWARYQMYDEAKKPVVLGYNADGSVNTASGLYGFVKGGSDKVDTQFKLSVPAGSTISQIVFDAPRVDDDYLINKVTYTTATTYPVTITATPQDLDYSETITKVTVEVPKGVTLSAGTQIDATHWSLPLASNSSYSVSIDPVTKAVTITGLNMTVPENVQVNEIKVVAVATDGSSTADGSASFTSKPHAVDDTNSATLTSKNVDSPLANFSNNDSYAWKFDNSSSTRLNKSDSNLSSTNWQAGENAKWLVSAVNGWTLDGRTNGGGLVLTDNNGQANGDAKAVTPTYTSTVAGTTLQFKVTGFSNANSSSDSVDWTLYKSTDGGVTWSAVPGQANSGVITGTGTYTTTALEANATYRILLTVHEGNSDSTDAAVTFDDFAAIVPNPDTIVWSSTAVTGSVTSNDTLGTLGETSTLSVFNGSTWVNAASGGTTITGAYGTLLIKADGSYTYTPTASAAGAGKVEHFDYKLTQADGDTDTASLDISIDATGPGATTLAASRMASDTGSHEVHSTSSGDSLLGTAEDDLFIWHQGDAGTVSRPVTDVVKNFGASGKDALDLGDLLQGEETSSDLSKFLHLETRTEADGKTIDTVIKVSTAGALDANGNGFNQKILVEGVDLVGTSHDQNAMIKQLIDQGKLKIDHS